MPHLKLFITQRALGLGLTALLGLGCAPPPPPEFSQEAPALPGGKLMAAPDSEVGELDGVDTSGLGDREKEIWWASVNQLYSPCTDQAVSVAQCVAEARPCGACLPAARFLATRMLRGDGSQELAAAYAVRFGPDVKEVKEYESPAAGPAGAAVRVVVWHDFQCGACQRAMPELDALLTRFPKDVRLVHKFYPLPKHTQSEPAARAAIAARNQGKYWEMEKTLFQNQATLSNTDIEGYASQLGLDMDRFRKDMSADKTKEIIARDKHDAELLGLRGTPFIMINGRPFVSGLFSLEEDLESWVLMEIRLAKGDAAAAAPAAAPPVDAPAAPGPATPVAAEPADASKSVPPETE